MSKLVEGYKKQMRAEGSSPFDPVSVLRVFWALLCRAFLGRVPGDVRDMWACLASELELLWLHISGACTSFIVVMGLCCLFCVVPGVFLLCLVGHSAYCVLRTYCWMRARWDLQQEATRTVLFLPPAPLPHSTPEQYAEFLKQCEAYYRDTTPQQGTEEVQK